MRDCFVGGILVDRRLRSLLFMRADFRFVGRRLFGLGFVKVVRILALFARRVKLTFAWRRRRRRKRRSSIIHKINNVK